MINQTEFKDQVVVITGPTGNLGSAVVKHFNKKEASLVLLDRHPDRLEKKYPQLQDSKMHLLISSVNLLDNSTVNLAIKQVIDHYGRIDILIHTAGGFQMGEQVQQITDKSWDHMMDLNVNTLRNITRAVIPHMLTANRGKIITIGARPALAGKAKMGAYSAAKTAVLRLTESMSAELKSQGINVNCIIPGTINTPANRKAMPDADTSRWVTPESLAEVIAFLVSDAARDIHGAAIPVYGA